VTEKETGEELLPERPPDEKKQDKMQSQNLMDNDDGEISSHIWVTGLGFQPSGFKPSTIAPKDGRDLIDSANR